MPSIFISKVMPRMPQPFGAVRIGPTRASENPDSERAGPVSPDRRCRVRSSKSYKRHQTGGAEKVLREEKEYLTSTRHTCRHALSLSVAPYLIFVHLTQSHDTPPHRPCISLLHPTVWPFRPSASDNEPVLS